MMNQTHSDNVDRVFAAIDLDGNGTINWNDFTTVAVNVGKEFGLDENAAEVKALAAAYRDLWDYIRESADFNDDASVDKAEFREAHATQRLSSTELLQKWQNASDRAFDIADRDKDGLIDEEALVSIYRACDIDPTVARSAYQAMDANKDGRIDKTELSANVRGLFTATSDSAKGSRLLSGS